MTRSSARSARGRLPKCCAAITRRSALGAISRVATLCSPGTALGRDVDHLVEPLHVLDVGVHLVHEQGVEHVAEQLSRAPAVALDRRGRGLMPAASSERTPITSRRSAPR